MTHHRSYFGQGARSIALVRSDESEEGFFRRAWMFAGLFFLLFALAGGVRAAHAASNGPVAPRLMTTAEQTAAKVGDRISGAFDVVKAAPMVVFTPPKPAAKKVAAIDVVDEARGAPAAVPVPPAKKETSLPSPKVKRLRQHSRRPVCWVSEGEYRQLEIQRQNPLAAAFMANSQRLDADRRAREGLPPLPEKRLKVPCPKDGKPAKRAK